jgi:hypothetical protein
MRDVAFASIREFYPDIAAHYIRKHREKRPDLLRETLPPLVRLFIEASHSQPIFGERAT